MRIILQAGFGLLLAVVGLMSWAFLGGLIKGRPDWHTGVSVLVILTVGQGLAFVIFRSGVALQVLVGLALCAVFVCCLIYSNLSFFWEPRYADGSSPITWRSDLMLVFLIGVSQWASSMAFRAVRHTRGEKPLK